MKATAATSCPLSDKLTGISVSHFSQVQAQAESEAITEAVAEAALPCETASGTGNCELDSYMDLDLAFLRRF